MSLRKVCDLWKCTCTSINTALTPKKVQLKICKDCLDALEAALMTAAQAIQDAHP